LGEIEGDTEIERHRNKETDTKNPEQSLVAQLDSNKKKIYWKKHPEKNILPRIAITKMRMMEIVKTLRTI
jgi:hypothetical protein